MFPNAEEIQACLNTVSIGKKMVVMESVGSTNDFIKRKIKAGEPAGLCVLAHRQTHGRGRMGRSWISEPAVGLYFSIYLKPELSLEHLPRLTLMTSVAMARAIDPFCPTPCRLKWPNDLLINGKKICGILSEYCAPPDPEGVILGIGINVNQDAERFPAEFRDTATSLKAETGATVDRSALFIAILQQLDREYQTFLYEGECKLAQEWERHSDMLGREITLNQSGTQFQGVARGLDKMGNLMLETPEGQLISFDAGEVTLRT